MGDRFCSAYVPNVAAAASDLMCTDEEAARRLHLEINGGSRRQRKGSQDQTRTAKAGLARKPKVDGPQAVDMDVEKSDNIGRPGKP